jgi:hypothetical protein
MLPTTPPALVELKRLCANGLVPLPRSGEYLHMRCCAHILNLLAEAALSVVAYIIYKLRVLVKHIRFPKQTAIFLTHIKHHDEWLDPSDRETQRLVGVALPTMDVRTR